MNVYNARSRYYGVSFNTRSRSRKPRVRKGSTAPQTKTLFPISSVTPDYDLREVVAERFMTMSAAHDRIRTKLLATGR